MRRFVNVAGATVTAVGIAMLLSGNLAAQGSRRENALRGHPGAIPTCRVCGTSGR